MNQTTFSEEAISRYCEDSGFARTGVFASEEQTAEAIRLMTDARNAPVARVAGAWLNEDAQEFARRQIHQMALSCGLPDLPPRDGHDDLYGLMANREFVKVK